jgi:hypothetical protein
MDPGRNYGEPKSGYSVVSMTPIIIGVMETTLANTHFGAANVRHVSGYI